jgi:hypothetical protein
MVATPAAGSMIGKFPHCIITINMEVVIQSNKKAINSKNFRQQKRIEKFHHSSSQTK